jgi:tripartite-type tricarboxylate transporter receptor subunit TctC
MDVAVRLNQAFNDALNTPELRGKLESAGWSIRGGSAQEAVALIQADMEVYRPIVKAANIKLD